MLLIKFYKGIIMKDIMEKLQEYKEHIESQGLTVYAIALKGSQNYNLSDEESDKDYNDKRLSKPTTSSSSSNS